MSGKIFWFMIDLLLSHFAGIILSELRTELMAHQPARWRIAKCDSTLQAKASTRCLLKGPLLSNCRRLVEGGSEIRSPLFHVSWTWEQGLDNEDPLPRCEARGEKLPIAGGTLSPNATARLAHLELAQRLRQPRGNTLSFLPCIGLSTLGTCSSRRAVDAMFGTARGSSLVVLPPAV